MIEIEILLPKLESEFGIIGSVALWIRSYLTDRECYVAVGGSTSVAWRCCEGVPQGSVLGPLIFSGYVSPLRESSTFRYSISSVCWRHAALHSRQVSSRPNTAGKLGQRSDTLVPRQRPVNERKQERGIRVRNKTTALPTHGCRRTDRNWWHGDCRLRPHQNPGRPSGFHAFGEGTSRGRCKGMQLPHSCPPPHTSTTDQVRRSNDVYGMVTARLDYCNSLLQGTSKDNIARLQRVQNSLARVVLCASWKTPSKPLLMELHWLPV